MPPSPPSVATRSTSAAGGAARRFRPASVGSGGDVPSSTILRPEPPVAEDDTVRVDRRSGAVVVAVRGPVDRSVLAALDRAIAGVDGPVVVDLDDAVIVDPRVLDPQRWRRSADRFAVVCHRSSGRHLVYRVLKRARVTVARTIDEALAALAGAPTAGGRAGAAAPTARGPVLRA